MFLASVNQKERRYAEEEAANKRNTQEPIAQREQLLEESSEVKEDEKELHRQIALENTKEHFKHRRVCDQEHDQRKNLQAD